MHDTLIRPPSLPAQPDLFNPSRWPRRPYCTDDFADGVRIRSLKQALTKAYIQPNPPHLRVWSIYDIDRPGGALAWEAANLPEPSWVTINKQNAHAHIVYGLSAPVLVMLSDKSYLQPKWSSNALAADVVLNVDAVAKRSLDLGQDVTLQSTDPLVYGLNFAPGDSIQYTVDLTLATRVLTEVQMISGEFRPESPTPH